MIYGEDHMGYRSAACFDANLVTVYARGHRDGHGS
jgi:hypothetical protein